MAQPPINTETVNALIESVRELLRDEEDRAGSLTGRAGGLTGFAGIILTLTGVAAKSGKGLDGSLRDAVMAMSVGALVFLAVAVIVSVFGVLLPSASTTIATSEVLTYPTYQRITDDPTMAQGRIMRGLITALVDARARNSVRAVALRFAYFFLFLGLSLVTATGITLAATGHFYV